LEGAEDRGSALTAWLAFPIVHPEEFEGARLIRLGGRAEVEQPVIFLGRLPAQLILRTALNGFVERAADRCHEPMGGLRRDGGGGEERMDSGFKQGFVGVNVPDTRDDRQIEQSCLDGLPGAL